MTIGEEHGAFQRDYAFGEGIVPVDFVPEAQRATFQGFRRSNGTVGTRNYIGILTSVNCSTRVSTAESYRCTAPCFLRALPCFSRTTLLLADMTGLPRRQM